MKRQMKTLLYFVIASAFMTTVASGQNSKIIDYKAPDYFVAGQAHKIEVTYSASKPSLLVARFYCGDTGYVTKVVENVKTAKNKTVLIELSVAADVEPSPRYRLSVFLKDPSNRSAEPLDQRTTLIKLENKRTLKALKELYNTKPGEKVGPTDPKISPNAKRVYNYLQSLRDKDSAKCLTGQYFYANYKPYYDNVVKLHEKTGEWVGMLHSTYENSTVRRSRHCSSEFIYPLFYNNWHRGALLMILINPPNPWHGQGRGFKLPGQDTMIPAGHSIDEIFDPKSKAHRVYKEILACHADNLEYFHKHDIPIIIRLFGENNGHWFWFQHGSKEVGPANFRKLWQMTVDYFREERGMHNLLFCYEVTDHREGQLNGLVPDKTDILGVQVGKGILEGPIGLYHRFLPYGKPIVLPQLLIGGDEDMKDKNYDTLQLLHAFKKWNPALVSYTPWNDNPEKGKYFSIVSNKNPEKFMRDPYMIHRSDTPFVKKNPPSLMKVPESEAAGTKDVAEGTYSWNFNGNEGKWKGKHRGLVISEKDRSKVLSAHQADKRLNLIFHGGPVSLVSGSSFSIDAEKFRYLNIRMRHYSQARKLAVLINGKAVSLPIDKFELNYSNYKIDLSKNSAWKKIVKNVEIIFGFEALAGSVEIDNIYFSRK